MYIRIVSLIILIILTSCRLPIGGKSTPTLVLRNTWIRDWLADPMCQPPCFLRVTPRTSSMTETTQLLSSMPNIQIKGGPSVTTDGKNQELIWDFPSFDQNDSGRILSDIDGTKILSIELGIRRNQSLKLSEIVSSFGTPDDVHIGECRGRQCAVYLVYWSKGMVLESLLRAGVDDNFKHTVNISPDAIIDAIWFFPPDEEELNR